jgi:hypothetical protein
LVPLTDIIQGLDRGASGGAKITAAAKPPVENLRTSPRPQPGPAAPVRPAEPSRAAPDPRVEAPKPAAPQRSAAPAPAAAPVDTGRASGPALKDALLAEIQKTKKLFYGTVIAQAQRIDVDDSRVVLTFGPQHRIFKQQVEQNRSWIEEIATRLAGQPMTVAAEDGDGPAPVKTGDAARGAAAAAPADKQSELKQKAMADSAVQAMLDVFGTDIKEVEEM